MFRRILAPLAILLCFAISPAIVSTPADAVSVNINVGSILNNGRGISCSQGERLLRLRGFRDVRRVDCQGRFFVYRGWLGLSRYEIGVRSRDGRIVDLRRIRR